MPKNQLFNTEDLIADAMTLFWDSGYSATSMNDLVSKTRVSRKGIYKSFTGKHELFTACLEHYREEIVTPAFAQVEDEGANLTSIERYFEFQIRLAEKIGFPGVGCLFGNTMTEAATHDTQAHELVVTHNKRLKLGFLNALYGELKSSPSTITDPELNELAELIACTTQGIWAHARVAEDANELRSKVKTLIMLVRLRITT